MRVRAHRTSCVAAGHRMKSAILYPYGPLTGTGCCRMLHAKNLAITSAIYTINISILIVLIYAWRISVNVRKAGDLEDVYYGVQIAYFAIIGTQMSMIVLSIMLLFGIYKENPGLIVPWIIGYITFMALEAVAMVYSNVLRDHVNKQFDAMCKAEVAFFIARAFINVLAMWGVLRFYNLVRAGITWKGPEARTLTPAPAQTSGGRGCRREGAPRTTGCFFFDFDFDDYDYDDEDDEDDDEDLDEGTVFEDDGEEDDDDDEEQLGADADCSMLGGGERRQRRRRLRGHAHRLRHHHHHHHHHHHTNNGSNNNNNVRSVLINKRHNKYKIAHPQSKLEVIDELERSAGSGSDENETLLVAYDSNSPASV